MVDLEVIREFALETLGFNLFGVTSKKPTEFEKEQFINLINQKKHGTMSFLENYIDVRLDPNLFFENYKSVIVVAQSYYQKLDKNDDFLKYVSKFAFGRDYHNVIRKKLKKFLLYLNQFGINGKISVDSTPVLEKFYAKEAGIGWQGKNTLIINKKYGSFIFLGLIFVDYPFENSSEITNLCGSCSKCINACPTKALDINGLNPLKCISYHTIESKNETPEEIVEYIFGCDICQNVCPWNRDLNDTIDINFTKKNYPFLKELVNINEFEFDKIFQGSSIKRAGYKKFIKQANRIYQNS